MAAKSTNLNELVIHDRLFELYNQMLGDVRITNVLLHTTRVVRQALDAERATTYLVLKETHELESAAIIGNVSRAIRVPIRADSLAGYCALTGQSFAIPDAYGDLSGVDPRLEFDRSWDKMNRFRTRDVMCAPAVFKDEVMGVVQVINSKGRPFQEVDLGPLQTIARLAGYALHHAQLYHQLATLKELEKEKAEFMRILVHELKSPVAASKSLASALQFSSRGDPKLSFVLDRIKERMDQLLLLVEDILQLSRIKSGKPLGKIMVCDLGTETRMVCGRYREQAKAKNLSLTLIHPQSPVPVRIDVQGYHLILSNLVSNAVKYTPAGTVKVHLQSQPPWAVLEVKDTGMGIPKGDIPHLFDEFFRASNARRSQIHGTGVGLSGGQLEVATQESVGSTFTVRLPLHSGREPYTERTLVL